MYKNSVLAWNPEENRFDRIDYKGDFHPRYLAGSGFNPGDSLYYIIGGYGSESGKQSESPDYYYEITTVFPWRTAPFPKCLNSRISQDGFCFANSLVFDDSNNTVCPSFPKV